MSLRSWAREHLKGSATSEVHSGRPEDTGGQPQSQAADQHSTTGTTPNDIFVGRASGDDPGYLETGAEQRAHPDTEPGSDA
ncbi:hypothetical protein [Streptomyces sp. NPDC051776]|uniref:hypothetical protein n=1 Tax=Streptomyces sp. NPDC051776 TaxID=3155414 RepID=UPI0034423C1A